MVLYLVLCLCAWQTVNTLNEILLSLLHNIDSKVVIAYGYGYRFNGGARYVCQLYPLAGLENL